MSNGRRLSRGKAIFLPKTGVYFVVGIIWDELYHASVGVSIEWRSYHYILVIKHPHELMGPHMHRQSCDKHLDLWSRHYDNIFASTPVCLFASRALV